MDRYQWQVFAMGLALTGTAIMFYLLLTTNKETELVLPG